MAKLSAEKKAKMGLEHLVDIGHIIEADVNSITNGVKLAGAPVHLTMVFAVSYMALLKNSVPMRDIIDMAEKYGRRINLSWSVNRWRDAHDEFSRIATLKALAEDRKDYPVDHYIKAMPEGRARQTVIRNSIRLGHESRRQRHCVASYTSRCENGTICICSVVINKQRWTVELHLQEDGYILGQVGTKRNGRPTREILTAINELYQPDEPKKLVGNSDEIKEQFKTIATLAREHNILGCDTSFSGCGDCGQHDSFDFTGTNKKPIDEGEIHPGVRKNIEEFMEQFVDSYDVNWWDNDGGNGVASVNFYTMIVNVDINCNYNESVNQEFIDDEVMEGVEDFAINEPDIIAVVNNNCEGEIDESDSNSNSVDSEDDDGNNSGDPPDSKTFIETILETGVYKASA